jgi:hypothetical protein
MLERLTGLDYSGVTSKVSGIDTYNYSVDALKKAAFVDEINNVLKVNNLVDKSMIICYLENRIKEIDKRYK